MDLKKVEREATPVERFFTRSPFSIVTMVARIRGNVSADMLKNAFAKVRRRHALLNVCIKDDANHRQWFTSAGALEIPTETVPRTSEDDWIKIHSEASRNPFEFDTRTPIRLILVHSPDVSELIILCHHIICDGMSLAYLARDLMVHLGDPAREAEVLPAPAPISLDNLPDDLSHSAIVRYFINRMNRQWAKQAVYFDQQDYRELTKAYWDNYHHELFTAELSAEETASFVARCRQEKVTVNSALTAAFCGAQRMVEGDKPYHERMVIAADLRDRLPNPAGEGMGMYAGGIQLKFKYNQKRGFWDNARQLHSKIQPKITNKNLFSDILNWLFLDPTIFEAMHFKKLGGLVPSHEDRYDKLAAFSQQDDVVMRLLKRDRIESLETKLWGTAVTNLGRLDFPTIYGPFELDRLIMQPGGGIPLANANLVLGAVTCADKLSLVVEYAPEAIEPQTVARIKEKALSLLIGA